MRGSRNNAYSGSFGPIALAAFSLSVLDPWLADTSTRTAAPVDCFAPTAHVPCVVAAAIVAAAELSAARMAAFVRCAARAENAACNVHVAT